MFPGFLIEFIIVLIVIGLLLWVVQQIPIDQAIKNIIRVVVIVAIAIWLIYMLAGFFLPVGGWPHR